MLNEKWKRGEKSELARRAGYSRAFIGQVLSKKRNASLPSALKLEAAARSMGIYISRYAFMEATITDNDYFG